MRFSLFIFFWFIFISSAAQLSEGGLPYSYHQSALKSKAITPVFNLKKLNSDQLKAEDRENPTPFRYSIFEEVNLNIKQGLVSEINEPKGKIWRYSISAVNCHSIQVVFKIFRIPPGAKLFLYDNDYSTVYGAFTNINSDNDSGFTIADFPGNHLNIEYFEPENAAFSGTLIIGQIGQAYQNIFQEENLLQERSYIDINCNEGKSYQTEKHAVCKITFRSGTSGYVCSGALINNTSNDGTPYFLTANHCIEDTTVAKTIVTYFNYERTYCNGRVNNGRTLSGARLMTTGTKSDYTLVRLNNIPPASYMPFYAGWDIGNYQDNYNVSIHHPEGIEKKISIDYDKIVTYDYTISWDEGATTPPSSHWMVSFDTGITSEGSSGGPLFSKQKRIIGQLHGGSDNEEFYGKLNYSWNNNNSGLPTLKTFLDPKNTGATFVNGYYPPTNPPDAFFSSSFINVCLNYPVTFFDHSAFAPSSINWTISPSGFRYINNTNRNSPNPQVEFTTAGTYTVKLSVSNKNGSDSLQVSSYISAGANINVSQLSSAGKTVCYSQFDSLVITGLGAANYTWSLEPLTAPFELTRMAGDTAILKKKLNSAIDSTFSLFINLSGTMGTCTDTSRQIIRFIKQFNDNIANAIEIGPGISKTFSNSCATIETNEPIPPFDSCTGLKSWCDEYGTGKDIVENSVWFKFQGPATGKAGLKSLGFDNQIAIYDANSYQDILAGRYTLLAANDDETDTNPNPVIPEVIVTPGKTYWVQVDGSGGGSEGSFTLTLSGRNITNTSEIHHDESFSVYPQPVADILHIYSSVLSGKNIDIKILSLSGKVWMHTSQKNTGDKISLNVESLSPGIYLINISQDNKSVVRKFVKL